MRTSLEVADIFRAAGPAYRTAHAGHLSLHQLKIMSAIEHCRTAALGGHVEACTDCGHWRIAYNSCRNRHRSEEHTSELQSLMRNSYAVFCLKKKKKEMPQSLPYHTSRSSNSTRRRKQHINTTV